MTHTKVTLSAISVPRGIEGINTSEEFLAYAARVSNPDNQINSATAPKLLKYLAKHSHWSPFEMVSLTMQIETTRDIGRQILRHRSFSFQEFSQRYAISTNFVHREARMQDDKNRQNSIKTDNAELADLWRMYQSRVLASAKQAYDWAITNKIAKEQARAVLPEGMTCTTMFMAGTLRSWIHYCGLRAIGPQGKGTQLEHQEVAQQAWEIICKEFASLENVLNDEPLPQNSGASN